MKRMTFLVTTGACVIFAALAPRTPGAAAAVSYAYDASVPLDYVIERSDDTGGVRVSEVAYRSGDTLIRAALVAPAHPAQAMPGVLFAHWLGDPATTNRSEFIEDAKWLARRGVVSLVPDQPWSRPQWFERVRRTQSDDADSIAEVVALRRSLDALERVPGVDPKHMAFVGHDFGAMYGALLAATDARCSAFVFMAPTVTFAEWFLLDTARPPSDPMAYATKMSAFDIPKALATIGVPTLVQFASHDRYVPRAKADAFAAAVAPSVRDVRRYDTGHALATDAATDDRRGWLAQRLDLR